MHLGVGVINSRFIGSSLAGALLTTRMLVGKIYYILHVAFIFDPSLLNLSIADFCVSLCVHGNPWC